MATTNYKRNAGQSGYLNESELNNDSGNLKVKCVESRTKLISGR